MGDDGADSDEEKWNRVVLSLNKPKADDEAKMKEE